jgi:uncharacterized repeat protein (TIGR02543 family)
MNKRTAIGFITIMLVLFLAACDFLPTSNPLVTTTTDSTSTSITVPSSISSSSNTETTSVSMSTTSTSSTSTPLSSASTVTSTTTTYTTTALPSTSPTTTTVSTVVSSIPTTTTISTVVSTIPTTITTISTVASSTTTTYSTSNIITTQTTIMTTTVPTTTTILTTTKPMYTVLFDSMGGSFVESRNYEFGEVIDLSNMPTKKDFLFAGWYTDIDYTHYYANGTMPQHQLTLYAKWVSDAFVFELKEDYYELRTTKVMLDSVVFIPHEYLGIEVQSIAQSAFANQIWIEELHLPSSIKYVHDYAFSHMSSLQFISFHDTQINHLSPYLFFESNLLVRIELPYEISSIDPTAFLQMAGLESVVILATNPHFQVIEGVLFNKEADTLLFYPTALTGKQYVIPASVKQIQTYAFHGNQMLESIGFEQKVEVIESNAFSKLTNLVDVLLPQGTIEIQEHAFYQLPQAIIRFYDLQPGSLWHINYHNQVKEVILGYVDPVYQTIHFDLQINQIMDSVSYEVGKLVQGIPSPISADYTFMGWYLDSKRTQPFIEELMPDYEFTLYADWSSPGLVYQANGNTWTVSGIASVNTSIWIPTYYQGKLVTSIANNSFNYEQIANFIEHVYLPGKLETIGVNSLRGFKLMKEIYLPSTLLTIGESSLIANPQFDTIHLLPQNPHFCLIEGVLYRNDMKRIVLYPTALEKDHFIIPSSIDALAARTFYKTTQLKKVSFESGSMVSTIPQSLFAYSRLEEIIIPEHVTLIESYAFYFAESLHKVLFASNSTLHKIEGLAFSYTAKSLSIIIPSSVKFVDYGSFQHTEGQTIYCQTYQLPTTWSSSWVSSKSTVIFGYSITPSIQLTMDSDGGSLVETISQEAGTIILSLPVPIKSGFIFSGWYIDQARSILFDSTRMPLEHTVLYADWGSVGLLYELVENGYQVSIGSLQNAPFIQIPNLYNNVPVRVIKESGFAYSWATKIIIGASVQTIQGQAFAGSTIQEIHLGPEVSSIGLGAFKDTYELKTIGVDSRNEHFISVDQVLYTIDQTTLVLYPSSREWSYVILPSSVRQIGAFAFCGLSVFTQVHLNEGLEIIGEYAFSNSIGLEELMIPKSLKEIGSFAFYYAQGISKIIFSSDSELTTIGSFAFGFSSFNQFVIPKNVSSIGESAFYGMDHLTEIRIPVSEHFVTISDYAFAGITGLKTLFIPRTVVFIGNYAFSNNYSLERIEFEAYSQLHSIGEGAFAYNSMVKKISLPASVEVIGNYAFSGNSSLQLITLRTNITSMGYGVFGQTPNLTIGYYGSSIPTTWNSDWNSSYRPVQLNYTPPTKAKVIFHTGLENVTQANIEVTIGSNIPTLSSPTASTLQFAGWYLDEALSVFYTPMVMPEDDLHLYADWGTKGLSYKLVNGTYEVSKGTASVVGFIPTRMNGILVTRIADYGFANLGTLTRKITLPKHLVEIGDYAFQNAYVYDYVIPSSVKKIGKGAFSSNIDMRSFTILGPSQLESIGESAFGNCYSLNYFNVPANVHTIGKDAFMNCQNLMAIGAHEHNLFFEGFQGALYSKGLTTLLYYPANNRLSIFEIPDTVTKIVSYAIGGNPTLKHVYIPISVTILEENAITSNVDLKIYAEHMSKPSGWHLRFTNSSVVVLWNQVGPSKK